MGEKTNWKTIDGFPAYRVNQYGVVESCVKRIGRGQGFGTSMTIGNEWKALKVHTNKQGYPVVNLGRGKTRKVCHLVLNAFYRKRIGLEECRHLDSNKLNSSLSNLVWGTSRENTQDQRDKGTLVGGENHGMAKISNKEVESIKGLSGSMTQARIGKMFGISQTHVSDILKGRRRTQSSHEGRGL